MKSLVLKSIVLAAALALAGCANLAPEYQRPEAAIPAAWPQSAAAATPGSAADLDGSALFTDQRLRASITLALENSRDLRLAVLAIEQARATYGIQSAALLPTLNATAGASVSRTPAAASSSGTAVLSRSNSVQLGLAAYELDFFGRVQNLKDAALESYLNTEEAARSTRLTLVAEVANAWLTLAADHEQLTLARSTLATQQQTYAMTERRAALGADSGLTLAQARTSLESARRDVAAYQAQVQQDRNALDLLAGTTVPDELLPTDGSFTHTAQPVALPDALPSTVLQRRPDVLAAEHLLKAAHADIGAARAALYPSISLTAAAGTASRSLGDLFKGGAWSFAPSVSLPIFDGGAKRSAVTQAEVARQSQLATYDKTLQTAFREVADALAVRASMAERLSAQTALVEATQRSLTLAQARQRVGADSYLDVLDAQRSLVTAQQALITLQLAEQSNRVTLFKVLGGGWSAT